MTSRGSRYRGLDMSVGQIGEEGKSALASLLGGIRVSHKGQACFSSIEGRIGVPLLLKKKPMLQLGYSSAGLLKLEASNCR